jgi:hypothetical protein
MGQRDLTRVGVCDLGAALWVWTHSWARRDAAQGIGCIGLIVRLAALRTSIRSNTGSVLRGDSA